MIADRMFIDLNRGIEGIPFITRFKTITTLVLPKNNFKVLKVFHL